jgi:serine protease AprX
MSTVPADMEMPTANAAGGASDLPLSPRSRRSRRRVIAAVTTLAMTAVTLGAAASSAAAHGTPKSSATTPSGAVVVFGCADPGGAVKAAGGKVTADLSLIHGVSATLPVGSELTGCTVVANHALKVSSAVNSNPSSGPAETARQTLGLTSKSPDGDGITVAVVDTGVDDSPDLAHRVVHVDVTGTSHNSDADDYGHGTFVAGLIAGDGKASGGAYQGAAPDAKLLDVRVAKDDGSTSLIDVLRGLEVVAAKQKSLDIRVLNLSLSSGSPIPFQLDPLSQALEALWSHGIVVVVPAGNDGPTPGSISSPGSDPVLLTVGALDESATALHSDDAVADYSSRGPAPQGVAKPDLVAPGNHLISLRAPGSDVDVANPGSRIGTSYFRGSGTSMSTAITSGVVADLLDARPKLNPDQVKAIVTGSAYQASGLTDPDAAGAGGLDAAAAFTARTPSVSPVVTTLDWPKGQDKTFDHFSAALLRGDRAAAYKWWMKLSPSARSWVARSWTALSPTARSWVAEAWSGRSWVGADGTADDWLARSWIARSWTARSWTAGMWAGRSWTGRSWTARSWISDDFAARSWTGRSWTARSWTTYSWQ